MKPDITTVILTFNEEIHIERAILSAQKISRRVVIVDSFSTDKTKAIVEKLNVDFYANKFINQAQQFQWAVDNCNINSEWIFRLDADEYLEPELISEIPLKMKNVAVDVNGFCMKRKHFFLGRWIRFGGRYPLIMLRLFRRGFAHVEKKWMDEHIVLDIGSAVLLKHNFVDDNLNSISWFIEKHNRYASREMFDLMLDRYDLVRDAHKSLSAKTSLQASLKRFIKNNIYNKLPIFIRPTLYFIYRYIILLGFLDGKEGFAYHFMQAYWYRALVDLKCLEVEKSFDSCELSERLEMLEKVSGCTNGSRI